MGVVYLAELLLLGEMRALKFLAPELATNPGAVQRFLREAKKAAALGLYQPNIVKTLGLGQDDDGGFYIEMEYVDGPSLEALIAGASRGLPVERALEIVRGIAKGLEAAHAKGMVHRDIKPGNILLGTDDNGAEVAKIADFGIVTGTDAENRLTRTGLQPLTPEYASPEQWKGVVPGHQLDGRTDIYALGCVFFEMLTGTVPFHGEDLREEHIQKQPPAPSLLRPELGRWAGLDEIVLRMMAKAREHRQADVKVVLAELDRVVMKSVAQQPSSYEPRVTVSVRDAPKADGVSSEAAKKPEEVIFTSWSAETAPRTRDSGASTDLLAKPGFWVAIVLVCIGCIGGVLYFRLGRASAEQVSNYPAPVVPNGQPDYQPKPSVIPTPVPTPASNTRPAATKVEPKDPVPQRPEPVSPRNDVPNGNQPPAPQPAITKPASYNSPGMALYLDRKYVEAEPIFSAECNQGNMESCYHLGWMYDNNLGVGHDYPKATSLYSKACNGNYGEACYSLGEFYHTGVGVGRDEVMAHSLFSKGCSLGSHWACRALNENR